MAGLIVHISGDFPDAVQSRKTRAVSSLVDAVRDSFDQKVYSINRFSPSAAEAATKLVRHPVRPRFKARLEPEKDGVTAISYDGLKAGLYMESTLLHLADRIAADMDRLGIKPDLIHGHKLTLEGLIAERLSARFGCPYALSVQVNTDRKILRYRPDLKKVYRRIYHGAKVVFPFSVMGQRVCDSELGARAAPTIVLPCTSPEDRIIAPRIVDPVLASVFHLKDYQNKNVAALTKASSTLQAMFEGYAFHLYGGGTPEEEKEIDRLAARDGARSFVRKGKIAHGDVQQMLNSTCGFAMVSKRETFGMVFLEALLAGCPVVFPKDWAIDGFFDGASFAQGVSADDYPGIEAAMAKMIVDQKLQKQELADWQASGRLAQFQRSNVVATYRKAIAHLLDGAP